MEPSMGSKKAQASVKRSIVAKPRKDERGEVRDLRGARSRIVGAVVGRGDRAAPMMRSAPRCPSMGHP